jgi:hypothetical protein
VVTPSQQVNSRMTSYGVGAGGVPGAALLLVHWLSVSFHPPPSARYKLTRATLRQSGWHFWRIELLGEGRTACDGTGLRPSRNASAFS